jgi:hypothetical protein
MKQPYTYSVIRYVHDRGAGETLNVGVILFSPGLRFLDVKTEGRYERLSAAFANFSGEQYRSTIRRLNLAVKAVTDRWDADSLRLWPLPISIEGVYSSIWSDKDLNLQFGPVLSGVSDDPAGALEHLFDRMVISQYLRETGERRTDEQVWAVYRKPLVTTALEKVLQPKLISTSDFEIRLEHTFKNERIHALLPLSFDYSRPEALQNKAARWLGAGVALSGHDELAKLYFLLGAPQLQSQLSAYNRAKGLLNKIPLKHEMVEEDEAEDFATEIAALAKAHGVIP